MVDFGQRIKDLRMKRNLTQLQVAERVGISKAMISSYELSARQPSYDVLVKLATLYGVTTDFLLGIERGRYISAEGLTEARIALLTQLIEAFKTES